MANVTMKKEERRTPYTQGGYSTNEDFSDNEDIFDSFQSLEVDEARLTEQKEHLAALLAQLEMKAKDEFEKRKRKIDKLNSEVSELKRRCEKFANMIKSEPTLECRTAAAL